MYDAVNSRMYPPVSPSYKPTDYEPLLVVKKTLAQAKEKISKMRAQLPNLLAQNRSNWIIEDALQDVEETYKDLMKSFSDKEPILNKTLEDFKQDLDALSDEDIQHEIKEERLIEG